MAAYVDDYGLRTGRNVGRMAMSHLFADSEAELVAFADRLGLRREWIQRTQGDPPHYDVSLSKRREAIDRGARPVTVRQMVQIVRSLREPAREERQP